jgi:hypothetical protein
MSTSPTTAASTATPPLLRVTDLVRHYALPREKLFGPPPTVKALNGVSFTSRPARAWASSANRARASRPSRAS